MAITVTARTSASAPGRRAGSSPVGGMVTSVFTELLLFLADTFVVGASVRRRPKNRPVCNRCDPHHPWPPDFTSDSAEASAPVYTKGWCARRFVTHGRK